jgi:tape measure domain-containing protein
VAEVAVAYVTLIPSARGFRANTERALRPHVSRAGVSLGGVFGKSFGRTASAGLTSNTTGIRSALRSFSVDATRSFTTVTAAASTLVGVLGGIGIRTAASLQQARVGFETLLGSAKEATSFLSGVRDFAVRTPFEVEQLIANSRALLGVGVTADGIIPTLKSLGNVTAAFGLNQEQFNGILRAFTQIASKGKVQAEELLQISENGLPAMQLFAKGLGLTVEELLALTKEGKLTAKVALPALLKQLNKDYAGAMSKQFHTLTGVYNNFKESAKLALSDGVQPLVPILQSALPKATAKTKAAIALVSDGLKDFLNGLRGRTGVNVSFFESLGAGAAAVLVRVRNAFAGVKSIIEANKSTLTGIVQVVRDRILPALGSIADSVGRAFTLAVLTFFDVLGTVGVPVARALARGLERIAPALRKTVDFIAANQEFLATFAVALAGYAATVKVVRTATAGWAAAQVAVNTAMATNPYLAAFAAVVALAGAMVYLNETTGRAHNAFIEVGRVATAITVAIGRGLVFVIKQSLKQIALLLRILEAVSNPLGKLTGWKSPFGKAADQLDKAAEATDKWSAAIKSLPDRIEIPATITVNTVVGGTTQGLGLDGKELTPQQAAAQHAKDIIAKAQEESKKASTPKAPKFDFDDLLAQLGLPTSDAAADEAGKKAADRIKKIADKAKAALRDARREMKDYAKAVADTVKSFGSVINLASDNRDVTPSTVAGFLKHQLGVISRFQKNLRILAKRGISDSLLQQIADAGPEEGGAIAAALVRTNKGDFADIQRMDAEINRRAGAIGGLAAQRVMGDKVAEKLADVINITVNNPRPEKASESVPKAIRKGLWSAGAGTV